MTLALLAVVACKDDPTDSGDSVALDVCELAGAGGLGWSWPEQDIGRFDASDAVDGRISVVAVDAEGVSVLHVLDAADGSELEQLPLTGEDAPEAPLIDVDPDAPVGTAVFTARDAQGRTYVLHVPSSGDEASFTAMVYRYDADGTKAYGTALAGATHGGLQIEPDGSGGVLVFAAQIRTGQPGVVRLDSGGGFAWEVDATAQDAFHGFALDGDKVWLVGNFPVDSALRPGAVAVSLETGERTGEAFSLVDPPSGFVPYSAALAPGGGLYLLGTQWSDGSVLLRTDTSGAIAWSEVTGVDEFWNYNWTMDLDALEGGGVCAATPVPELDDARQQRVACFDADGQLLAELATVSNGEGGLDVGPDGAVTVQDEREGVWRLHAYCSPFPD